MRKKKKPVGASLTRSINHIRLASANSGKLAALDSVWEAYKPLCEQYIRLFCNEVAPDALAEPCYTSVLSARWQRVAIQQAAGITKSWHSNRLKALKAFSDKLTYYESLPLIQQQTRKKPVWNEPQIATLHAVSIQANENVALQVEMEKATNSTFDFWLRLSTLDKGHPLYLPVTLAKHHRKMLTGHVPNSSLTLSKRDGWWWLSLSFTQSRPALLPTEQALGLDVGIVNFLTDSAGHQYGTIGPTFMHQVESVKVKTARKAKLRACLKKKGVSDDKLPSTSSAEQQRLSRRVKHDIETAVVQCFNAHPNTLFVVERLDVSGMRFKSRRMNRYLKASQIGHIQDHLYWTATKRGLPVVAVSAAYSSQACPNCHYADRANRPHQQTFCCVKCGYAGHADVVAAGNLEKRLNDSELNRCRDKEAIKKLLDKRHADWLLQQPPTQTQ
jgi:IS605 OrfB family transposase